VHNFIEVLKLAHIDDAIFHKILSFTKPGGVDAPLPLPRDRGVEELHGDPTVGSRPKV